MSLLSLCLVALAAVAVSAGDIYYYDFTLGDWICDIRDCTASAGTVTLSYGVNGMTDYTNPYLAPVRLWNGQYPGPTVDVFQDDHVNVHVRNLAGLDLATSLHWHGMFQIGTDFMDGVVYISQCPINTNDEFFYSFQAYPAGSHWYHSHANIEAIEGVAGAVIVRRYPDPQFSTWGIGQDGSGYQNWNTWHNDESGEPLYWAEQIFAFTSLWQSTRMMHLSLSGNAVALLNGRWQDGSAEWPWQQYNVTSDFCWRFRFMYLDASDNFMTFQKISVDGHNLTVIEIDGFPVDPVKAKSVQLQYAQRTDAVFCPRPGAFNWYMNIEPLEGNNNWGFTAPAYKAIISVDGAAYDGAWGSITAAEQAEIDALPDFNQGINGDWSLVHLSWDNFSPLFPDVFWNSIGFEGLPAFGIPNATLFQELRIGYQVFPNEEYAPIGVSMYMAAGEAWEFPDTPLTISPDCASPATHSTWVPYDTFVDILIQNTFSAYHPMHMHGGAVWVLGSSISVGEGASLHTTVDQAPCPLDEVVFSDYTYAFTDWACTYNPNRHYSQLNTWNPPVRDTVTVPSHGWVYMRWRTVNPGYWFMHCHTESHMGDGMLFVWNVAPELRAPLPYDFPQCGACRTDGAVNAFAAVGGNTVPATEVATGKLFNAVPPTINVAYENSQPAVNVYCNGGTGDSPMGNGYANCGSGPLNTFPAQQVNVNFADIFSGLSF